MNAGKQRLPLQTGKINFIIKFLVLVLDFIYFIYGNSLPALCCRFFLTATSEKETELLLPGNVQRPYIICKKISMSKGLFKNKFHVWTIPILLFTFIILFFRNTEAEESAGDYSAPRLS
jgi:hypothetical protein